MTLDTVIETLDPSHQRHSNRLYLPGEDHYGRLVNWSNVNMADRRQLSSVTLARADVHLVQPSVLIMNLRLCPNLKFLDCKFSKLDFDHEDLVMEFPEAARRHSLLREIPSFPATLRVLKLDFHYVGVNTRDIIDLLDSPRIQLNRLSLDFNFSYITGLPFHAGLEGANLAGAVARQTSLAALELGLPITDPCTLFDGFLDSFLLDGLDPPYLLTSLVLFGDYRPLQTAGDAVDKLTKLCQGGYFAGSISTLELRHFEFFPADITLLCQLFAGFKCPPVLGLYMNNFVISPSYDIPRKKLATDVALGRLEWIYNRPMYIEVGADEKVVIIEKKKAYRLTVDPTTNLVWSFPACPVNGNLLHNAFENFLFLHSHALSIESVDVEFLTLNYWFDFFTEHPATVKTLV